MKKIVLMFMCLVVALSTVSCGGEHGSESSNSSFSEEVVSREVSISPEDSETSIKDLVAQMSLEEKLGQMMMLSFRSWDGEAVSTEIPVSMRQMISKYSIGNVILFAENFTNVEDTVKLTDSLQRAVKNGIPMFISTDQEGGNVVRLANGCSLIGNMALGAINSEEDCYTVGKITAEQLLALGVNVDFAPVLDVNNNPENPVINLRSFSEDPEVVAKLGVAMINGMQDTGMSACTKHFPGHGDTATDSHYSLPIVNKTLEELEECELVPFQAAIDSGVDIVMTAHIAFPFITEKYEGVDTIPATLSKTILTDILKEKMGFGGIVTTDSMGMAAITDNFSEGEAAVLAINAGVDMLLMCTTVESSDDATKLDNIISAVKQAISDGSLLESRIDDAVTRILTVKAKRGLFDTEYQTVLEKIKNANSIIACDEHRMIERSLSAKAVTVLENKTGSLFADFDAAEKIEFFVPSEDLVQSVTFSVERLKAEKKAGDFSYTVTVYSSRKEKNEVEFMSGCTAVVIFSATTSSWNTSGVRKIYNSAMDGGLKTAVVSCQLPYDAALFTNADVLMACYCPKGKTSEDEKAAFGVNVVGAMDVLFGASKGEGTLPVTVYKVSKDGDFDLSEIIYPFGSKFE